MKSLMILALAVAAQETVKDDFEKDNPKWKFAAGKWERRSGVLAQTAETQPWAVAVLEDRKFADVDVTVKFRPVSGKEDASGGSLFRARREELLPRAGQRARGQLPPLHHEGRKPEPAGERQGRRAEARRVAHDPGRRQGDEDPGVPRREAEARP